MAKKRFGFVTNSSSSSFIVAYRKGLSKSLKGELFEDKIKDFLKRKDGLDTYAAKYLNLKEIEDLILNNYDCETIEELVENDEENGLEFYNLFLGLSQNDYYFAIKEIGNWDDDTLNIIKNLEKISEGFDFEDEAFIIRQLYW